MPHVPYYDGTDRPTAVSIPFVSPRACHRRGKQAARPQACAVFRIIVSSGFTGNSCGPYEGILYRPFPPLSAECFASYTRGHGVEFMLVAYGSTHLGDRLILRRHGTGTPCLLGAVPSRHPIRGGNLCGRSPSIFGGVFIKDLT